MCAKYFWNRLSSAALIRSDRNLTAIDGILRAKLRRECGAGASCETVYTPTPRTFSISRFNVQSEDSSRFKMQLLWRDGPRPLERRR